MARKTIFICVTAIVLLCSAARAPAFDTQSVPGKTYNCYLYSELDFVDSHITFAEDGTLSLMRFKGSGRYVSGDSLFGGSFLALNLGFGGVFGDYLFSLTGMTAAQAIFGVGVMNVDYGDARYPFVFWGYETAAETTE